MNAVYGVSITLLIVGVYFGFIWMFIAVLNWVIPFIKRRIQHHVKRKERNLLELVSFAHRTGHRHAAAYYEGKLAALRGHRETAEAHRTGTPGGTSNSTPGSAGGTGKGASMSWGGNLSGSSLNASYKDLYNYYSQALVTTPSYNTLAPSSSLSKEFSGAPLGMGTVHGARSFRIDKLGRLSGVVYSSVWWTPGENHAECLAKVEDYSDGVQFGFHGADNRYYCGSRYDATRKTVYLTDDTGSSMIATVAQLRGLGAKVPGVTEPVTDPKEHGLETCPHGFYAYFDGSDDYHKEGYISAVIEGYGETVIGSRGFRRMKARILALTLDESVTPTDRRKVARNYTGIPIFDTFKEMVTEFPTDAGDAEITPDNTDDFWTREA